MTTTKDTKEKRTKKTKAKVFVPRIYEDSLRAVKGKYRQLTKEVESLPSGQNRTDLLHTVSKLGIFLDEAFGRDINTKQEIWNSVKTTSTVDESILTSEEEETRTTRTSQSTEKNV